MKSNLENLNFQTSIREQVVPSRKKVRYKASNTLNKLINKKK